MHKVHSYFNKYNTSNNDYRPILNCLKQFLRKSIKILKNIFIFVVKKKIIFESFNKNINCGIEYCIFWLIWYEWTQQYIYSYCVTFLFETVHSLFFYLLLFKIQIIVYCWKKMYQQLMWDLMLNFQNLCSQKIRFSFSYTENSNSRKRGKQNNTYVPKLKDWLLTVSPLQSFQNKSNFEDNNKAKSNNLIPQLKVDIQSKKPKKRFCSCTQYFYTSWKNQCVTQNSTSLKSSTTFLF